MPWLERTFSLLVAIARNESTSLLAKESVEVGKKPTPLVITSLSQRSSLKSSARIISSTAAGVLDTSTTENAAVVTSRTLLSLPGLDTFT